MGEARPAEGPAAGLQAADVDLSTNGSSGIMAQPPKHAAVSSASSTTEEDWHSTPATPTTATAPTSPGFQPADAAHLDADHQTFSDVDLNDNASAAAQAFAMSPPPAAFASASYPYGDDSADGTDTDASARSGLPSLSSPPPLPPRGHSMTPQRRLRPSSLASVIGAGGSTSTSWSRASPSSATASPRSPAFYPHSYLNRPLPQTPPSGSRPSSFHIFSSPTAPAAGTTWQPQTGAALQAVPRPLLLRSLPRTSTGGTSGGADYGLGISGVGRREYDYMTWLRAHQSAARMARRRHLEQRLSREEYDHHLRRLESHEGAFEVQQCFLVRLACAENDMLENFPHSYAEQKRQQDSLAAMRQDMEEALLPLLAYGPSEPEPLPPRPAAPAVKTTMPMSPMSLPPAKAGRPVSVARHALGLPPTPPLSPQRGDPRWRESGMSSMSNISSITEGSVNGSVNSSVSHGDENAATTADTLRQSVKRVSNLFGWGAAGAPSPAASTKRFSGD